MKNKVLTILKSAGLGFFSYALIDSLFQIMVFSGTSMEPTIRDNEIGLGEKLTSYKNLRR